jgi:hypothetical protein
MRISDVNLTVGAFEGALACAIRPPQSSRGNPLVSRVVDENEAMVFEMNQ